MKAINQRQLARALKVSRTTVSRSLSNHPTIPLATRERVQALAAELGYRNTPTRVLRRSGTRTPLAMGVLVGIPAMNSGMATFPHVLEGIRSRAAAEKISVACVMQDPLALQTSNLRQRVFGQIRTNNWRGLVIIYPFDPDVVVELSHKISTVSVLTEYDHLPVDTIDTDHSDIVGLIGSLAQLGHRKIGFVSWRYSVGGRWASRRFAAYAEGIFLHGLRFDPSWTLNAHRGLPSYTTPGAIADQVARSIRAGVTAWVCAADHQAYQLIGDLRTRGFDVPRDCSVTGFDGIPPPPGMPQVTTLSVPHSVIGSTAIGLLLSRILDTAAPRRKTLVETTFVSGETIGPAKR